MSFAPIAIIGQGCVLPGALSPAALWRAVREGRDLLSRAPPDRWGVSHERIIARTVDSECGPRWWPTNVGSRRRQWLNNRQL